MQRLQSKRHDTFTLVLDDVISFLSDVATLVQNEDIGKEMIEHASNVVQAYTVLCMTTKQCLLQYKITEATDRALHVQADAQYHLVFPP